MAGHESFTLTFLGTGTSTGVPHVGCTCPTCTSEDPRDKRLRTSALIRLNGRTILIDPGPDLRAQMLTHAPDKIDAVLITHSHYDHVGGIDDLRPYCHRMPPQEKLPVYCTADVAEDLRNRVPYCFKEHPYPGVPTFAIHEVRPYEPFIAAGIEVMPVKVMHWKLPILGFRIGPLAYVTDCKTMPRRSIDILKGTDTLVINALRHKQHMSHLSLSECLTLIEEISPRRTWLIHMADAIGPHAELEQALPEGVRAAYDNLTIKIPFK